MTATYAPEERTVVTSQSLAALAAAKLNLAERYPASISKNTGRSLQRPMTCYGSISSLSVRQKLFDAGAQIRGGGGIVYELDPKTKRALSRLLQVLSEDDGSVDAVLDVSGELRLELRKDRVEHWENPMLEKFMDAMHAWLETMGATCRRQAILEICRGNAACGDDLRVNEIIR